MNELFDVNKFIGKSSKWLNGNGKNSDIIISTRIRLARNLRGFRFTNCPVNKELEEIIDSVKKAVVNSDFINEMEFIKLHSISDLDREFLVERHLISPFCAKMNTPRAIFIGKGEFYSIVINEEDHLRIQSIQSGLDVENAWENIKKIDDVLKENVRYAYTDELGYLTACPTNTGTGMRVSFFCHLPGIVLTKRLEEFLDKWIPAGITVRGFYGEGTDAMGNIFQVSNQITLGISEKDTIAKIKNVAKRFVQFEKESREKLMNEDRIQVEDKVERSKAILQNAKIIPSLEFMSLLSAIRLGVDLKILKRIQRKILNELMIIVQPAHIQKFKGKKLNELEKDILRAEIIKSKINF